MQITSPTFRGLDGKNLYFCSVGEKWVLPRKASYIFNDSPRELDTFKERKYGEIFKSRRFEVRGALSLIPYVVNIGVNLKTQDPEWDCLLWIHLYFGPKLCFYDFANPSGNMEAPF